MPLNRIQREILGLLASRRDPESYVAGASVLNRNAARFSGDIDIFQDREERVSLAAMSDGETLEAAGYQVKWLRREPLIYAAEVVKADEGTRLEWVADSDFRFFPVIPDALFGFVLNPVDLALNKVMAVVGRREVRDLVDLLTVHERILPLGALAWAAVEKSPGFTPEGLLAEIRRGMHYPREEWNALTMSEPIDPAVMVSRLRRAVDEAEQFVVRMPTEELGLLFLEGGKVVQPDVNRLGSYASHAGRRRGHWPASAEIQAAMLAEFCR